MMQPGAPSLGRALRCEGTGPQSRGCFNWVNLGTLTEMEFRATFGAILCLACYVNGWTGNHTRSVARPIRMAHATTRSK